jgi:predicted enzyme related to lactoylglutathione lyase
MATNPGSFIWYELMTTDSNAASRFYGAVVGWTIPDRPDPQTPLDRDYRMIGRSDGGQLGGVLQLTAGMQAQGAGPCWLGYLSVADVGAATRAIEADGGHTHLRLSLPVGDIAMVSDPMGAVFYVMRPVPPPDKPDAVSDVFHPTAPQHAVWNELLSADLARAKAFYAKHFGFAFNESMPMGEMGDYCFFDHGGLRPGAIMKKPADFPVSGWLTYFGVPSLMKARAAIESQGGRVLQEPHEVPGGVWILVAADPQGATFGLAGPKGD